MLFKVAVLIDRRAYNVFGFVVFIRLYLVYENIVEMVRRSVLQSMFCACLIDALLSAK